MNININKNKYLNWNKTCPKWNRCENLYSDTFFYLPKAESRKLFTPVTLTKVGCCKSITSYPNDPLRYFT